ncbi:MAG: UDP-N-acetylmuramoyl-L-alanine--D-glutamate ligase [Actinomycetes bacterium]
MTAPSGSGRRPALPEGPFLVCGLARSGQAVARVLARMGETVVAVDSASPDGAGGLAADGVEVHLDGTGEDLVRRVRTIVKSPGVPGNVPVLEAARSAGLPVLGELEIGWRLTSGPVIAVTGTNGKTTVTEMAGHLMHAAGREVAVAGNVGRPISDLAGKPEAEATIVAESSSFQLEDCDGFAPEVAVFLNISPDHLDRHGTMESYRSAKLRIFEHQTADDFAVVPLGENLDDVGGQATRVTFGGAGADLAVVEGTLRWRGTEILGQGDLKLPGAHNLLNAAAASAACISLGVDPAVAGEALRSFPGVPHRLELVAEAGGVRWFNDSKSTNVASTLTALASLDRPAHLILGGQGKGQDFSALAEAVDQACVSVSLIGEAADEIARSLPRLRIPVVDEGDLAAAVESLRGRARPGEAVLLSPACASFDQFSDFEHRGVAFRSLVKGASR